MRTNLKETTVGTGDRYDRKSAAIVNALPVGVVVLNHELTVAELNPAAIDLLGWSEGVFIGERLVTLGIDAAKAQALANGCLGDPNMHSTLLGSYSTTDEREVVLTVSGFTHDHFVLTAVISSEPKSITDRYEQSLEALRRSNAELDHFAFVASHDLKAPLRVIENATSWLAEDLEEHLSEDTRENLHLVQNRAARMRRFLDDLLKHSRIRATASTGVQVTGAELLQDIWAQLDGSQGFSLEVSDTMRELRLHPCPLQTVLALLIENAIQHHDSQEGTVRIEASTLEEEYQISISDDGPGIAPEYHEKAFRLFHTLQPRDVVETSGLGLAMVRKQVDLIGGEIRLVSDGVRGSTFILGWPKRIEKPKIIGGKPL